MGPRRFHFSELDSTQDQARALLLAGEASPFWVTADAQHKGRGRHGRPWHGAAGNFYGTRVTAPLQNAAHQSLITGLALYQAARGLLPDGNLRLKWPNDLLMNEKKCAGILLEPLGGAMLIGIGVNLFDVPAEELPYPAAALWPAAPDEARAEKQAAFFDALEAALQRVHAAYDAHGFDALRAEWQAAGPAMGAPLTVQTGRGIQVGAYDGIGADGSLRLTHQGEIIHLHSADVLAG